MYINLQNTLMNFGFIPEGYVLPDVDARKLSSAIKQDIKENLEMDGMFTDYEIADMIISYVSKAMKISVEDIKGQARKREIVVARQMASCLIFIYTPLPLKAIGIIMGARDHSTIIHCKETISDLIDFDLSIKREFSNMVLELGFDFTMRRGFHIYPLK